MLEQSMPTPPGYTHSPETRRKIREALKGRMPKGSQSPVWKGGRHLDSEGYVMIATPGGKRRYAREHRYVMEQFLGRPLTTREIVHHKNGDRTDNRIENLELMTQSEHIRGHRTGVPRSPETIAKMRAARIGRRIGGRRRAD
jgi:hypothetical protein